MIMLPKKKQTGQTHTATALEDYPTGWQAHTALRYYIEQQQLQGDVYIKYSAKSEGEFIFRTPTALHLVNKNKEGMYEIVCIDLE
jgi:hypothetical protein